MIKRILLATLLILSFFSSNAFGATYYWKQTSGNLWSTDANWSPSLSDATTGDTLIFNGDTSNVLDTMDVSWKFNLLLYKSNYIVDYTTTAER